MHGLRSAEHFVTSSNANWLELYVRERLPAASVEAKGTILFVHGTFTPSAAFDCSAPGYSWLSDAAEHGFNAYALDLRGYGRSSKPPKELTAPGAKPLCRHDEALLDIDDVVKFARSRTGCERVHLVGWSWGTLTTALYALAHPGKVGRLVLTAPLSEGGAMALFSEERTATDPGGLLFGSKEKSFHILADAEDPLRFNRKIGAYGYWSLTDARRHGAASMPPGDRESWLDPAVSAAFDRDLRANLGTEGDIVEGPSGAQNDLFDYYVVGRRFYDPAELRTPTMVIRGDSDFANRPGPVDDFFERLGAEEKLCVHLGNMSHNFFLERQASLARKLVYDFLLARQAPLLNPESVG